LSILTLAQYVNNSIDIIVKLKIEAALINEKKERENVKISSDEEWEALLIKEEANIRKHISNTHKLKLCVEQMNEKITSLEKEKKNYEDILTKYKNMKDKVDEYKKTIKSLNQMVLEAKEREKVLKERKIRINKIKVKSCGETDEDNKSSSLTPKNFRPSKKTPSLQKKINNLNKNIIKRLENKKRNQNIQKVLNSRMNNLISTTRLNEEGKSIIDMDKYSTLVLNKNNSVMMSTIKNYMQKNKIKDSSINNSYLNSSQLFLIKNIKLNDKIDIYQKFLNRRLKNNSKKKKDNDFKSYRNNSIFISTGRTKKSFHSHSLENEFYSNRPKKAIDLSNNSTNDKSSKSCMMKKIFNRNQELLSVKSFKNSHKKITTGYITEKKSSKKKLMKNQNLI